MAGHLQQRGTLRSRLCAWVGTWIVGVPLFGSEMGSNYLITFVLAYAFRVVFQYFAVAPMRGLDLRRGLIAAITIDTLSLLAYQIGMFAFMGFQSRVYPDQRPISLSFWLDADRYCPGFRHHLSCELVVDPSRHQGKDVIGDLPVERISDAFVGSRSS